jgi:pimeloyl-ACP methyl ester carboxylesterase
VESPVDIDVPAAAGDAPAHLACTVTRPAKGERAPAVVLLKGTGPQDRDGNNEAEHYGLHRAIAAHLAAHGVASLRCDSRGFGGSTGRFWDGTFATYVRDAHAMLAALRRTGGVDDTRIGIVGHSEGGIVGPVVADDDGGVGAMVLIGAGAQPFADAVLWQARDEQRRAHAPPEQVEGVIAVRRAVLDALAAGRPLPASLPPAVRADIEPMVPWLKSRLTHDTRAENRRLRHLPMLLVQGGHDLSTPATDASLLRADLAAGHNPDAKLSMFPELDHFLVPARVDEEHPAGEADPHALDAIAAFVAGALDAP